MIYQDFSKVYDEFMDHSLYKEWQRYAEKNIHPRSSVLELGCGTGHLALLLKKSGIDITGLDASNDMLTLARENQIKQNLYFPLLHKDMRDLSEIGKYDAVISFNDSICYLKNEKEVKEVFEAVFQTLKENGSFLFDVHSILQMEEFKNFSYHDEKKGLVLIWDSYEGDYEHSVEHDLSFFIHAGEDRYTRKDERHKERTYPIKTYENILEKIGFKDIHITGDFKNTLNKDDRRWFFKAIKRGK